MSLSEVYKEDVDTDSSDWDGIEGEEEEDEEEDDDDEEDASPTKKASEPKEENDDNGKRQLILSSYYLFCAFPLSKIPIYKRRHLSKGIKMSEQFLYN